MSYLDAPFGFDPTGGPAGEVRAPKSVKAFARVVFAAASTLACVCVVLAMRRAGAVDNLSICLGGWAACWLGFAVRHASARVDKAGVTWGWGNTRVRMKRERIKEIVLYSDALALVPQRGSTWFLSVRDWFPMKTFSAEIAEQGFDLQVLDRRAPLRARLQSYGRMLDVVMIAGLLLALSQVIAAARS